MTDLFTSKDKALKAIGKTLLCAMCVFVAGAINAPRVSAAEMMPQVPKLKAASADQSVPVDQQPLTVGQPVPPNIVLMLDDSGSMGSDYMPDGWSHQVPDATKNGVYYDPSVLYNPPPYADSTTEQPHLYPASPGLTNAYENGFGDLDERKNLTEYNETFDYYATLTGGEIKPYKASYYYSRGKWHYYCPNGGDVDHRHRPYMCKGNVQINAFQYVDPRDDQTHYVAATGDCAKVTDASQKSNCLDENTQITFDKTTTTIGQNVANWFSYYHTRILMAKSGLMRAFSSTSLKPEYRIGFGSINANAKDDLPGPTYTFDNSTWGGGSDENKLAEVQPYGNGADGTQKAALWDWIDAESASGNTPLRLSLKAVGEYFETSQPWQNTKFKDVDKPLACRQSYAILTTDGFWNGSSPNMPNDGEVDNVNGPSISGSDNKSGGYVASDPFQGDTANTLADVAMYYWNHDLADGENGRPDIDNEVPVSGKADPAFWQHMTTFTIGMGFLPTGIDPAGTTPEQVFDYARGGTAITDFSWPTPSSGSQNNIADLLHAGVNGHGGFYSATSPQAFTIGLQKALQRISSRNGSGASLSASGATIGTDTYIYQVLYHTGDWSGSLYAYQLDADGNQADDPSWSAEAQMPAPDDRNIHTYNPDKSGSDADVAFEFDNLSDAEKSALGDDADAQKNMVQYLRGKLIEGDDWRARLTLGDIVDSQPIYVDGPDPDLYSDSRMDFAGSSDYKTFADNHKDVTPVLYVAANDGMLHGFDADTGKETYAYLPAAVILHGSETGDHSISQIADPDYGYQNSAVPHQYFNDGQLTVADVYMSGSWKVVLVGTTGRGHAKAVYALDVTDPDNVSLMWEKSAYTADCDNCAYIGQMTSKPIIAQVADGNWAVLMGNGYNSAKDQAALLQFDLSDGSLDVHTTNTDAKNGLSGPAIWIADSTNNISTVAYAGDLYGRVWSFPLNTGGTSTPSTTGTVLFTAKDASGNVQPITSAPAVQMDVDSGKRWVFFGTGKYLSADDVNDDSQQTWYGLIVNDADGNVVKATSRENLVERKIVGEGTDSKGNKGRAISEASEVDDIGKKDGWFIDLKDTGERMVVANQFNGSLLYGTSIIPSNTDPCDPSGSGWVMAIDPFTGTNPDWDVFGSTLTTGDGDDQKTRNTSGTYFGSMPNAPIFLKGVDNSRMYSSTSSGEVKNTPLKKRKGAGKQSERISWREVVSD